MCQEIYNKSQTINTELDENQLIEEFDNYLRIYKNVAKSTIKNHHIYIKRFFNWFDNYQLKLLKELNFENLNFFYQNIMLNIVYRQLVNYIFHYGHFLIIVV